MTVDLKLVDAYHRSISGSGKVDDHGDFDVYWDGVGTVYLNYGKTDDQIRLSSVNDVFVYDYLVTGGEGSSLVAAGPFDITSLFKEGPNVINVKVEDLYGYGIGTEDVVISGNISSGLEADAGGPYAGEVNSVITFDGRESIGPICLIATYEWDFGDGGHGNGATVDHGYAVDGEYIVGLTVTDVIGATDSDSTISAVTVRSIPDVFELGTVIKKRRHRVEV